MNELKSNKKLLEVGVNNESGSDSKPEEGEINIADVPDVDLNAKKKPLTPALT